MKKIELVVPAGNSNKLETAIMSGADSVYLGGRLLNMKMGTENFSDLELHEVTTMLHAQNKKVYVTLNAVPHNQDLEELPAYIKFLEEIKVDGVIISDMGVLRSVKENSNLKIIVQTHSSNTNEYAVKMWYSLGVKRIILDRDITLEVIHKIRQACLGIELEVFVHGSICLAISGRAIGSNYMKEKNKFDENKKEFTIIEETRPNEEMKIYEDKYGTYIFGARDICAIEILDKICDLGIDAIRIEGGMKSSEDLNLITKIYREALDLYLENEYEYKEEWKKKLETTVSTPLLNWYL